MVTGERGVVDVARWRGRDPVRAAATRRVEDLQGAGGRIEAAYTPFLPVNHSTPAQSKVAVVRFVSGRFEGSVHCLTARVFASTYDRVQTTVGHPRRAIGTDNDAVRADPLPSGTFVTVLVTGSRWPK